jgi:hypothetical protein
MANVRHLVAQVEGSGALWASGKITCITLATTVLTVTNLSAPLATSSDMTVSRTRTGNYLLTIANFKGPLGYAIPAVSIGSSDIGSTGLLGTQQVPLGISVTAPSYSGDTMTMSVSIASAGVFTDADVFFHVIAF